MDQKKIGLFLKALRKEKGFTQEQLAEHFQVSNRTISRWETGSNMPDLSMLVELADFYKLDISEIINGERKNKNLNKEEKEELLLVADYAENEKNLLLKRLRVISIIGLISLVVGLIMVDKSDNSLPVFNFIMGASFGVSFGALLTAVFYSTGLLSAIRKRKNNISYLKVIAGICIALFVILFVASIIASL